MKVKIRIESSESKKSKKKFIAHIFLVRIILFLWVIYQIFIKPKKFKIYSLQINLYQICTIDTDLLIKTLNSLNLRDETLIYSDSVVYHAHNRKNIIHNGFVEQRPKYNHILAEQYDFFGDLILLINSSENTKLSKKQILKNFRNNPKSNIIHINKALYSTFVDHKLEPKSFVSKKYLATKKNSLERQSLSIIIPTTFNNLNFYGESIRFGQIIENNLNKLYLTKQIKNVQIIIVIGPEVFKKELDLFLSQTSNSDFAKIVILKSDEPFNYSERVNKGLAETSHESILILNDDVKFEGSNQLLRGLEILRKPGIGSVSFVMHDSMGFITHAGVNCRKGLIDEYLKGTSKRERRPDLDYDRNVSANSFACVLIKKGTIKKCGILDENLSIDFNDVEWCLRVARQDLEHIVVAGHEIVHELSFTRKNVSNKYSFVPALESVFNLQERDPYQMTKLFCCYKIQQYETR